MKSNVNVDIRERMREARLTFRKLAEIMNISEATAYRMIASDLADEDKDTILKIIDEYEKGRSICD